MTADEAIAVDRENLRAKLAELRKHEKQVRTSPLRYLTNPWVHLGIAAIIGYGLGRRSRYAPAAVAPTEPMTHAIIRAGILALGQTLVRRAVVVLFDE
jgi:hypothetical protein